MQQPAKPELHKPAGGAGGGIIDILEVVEEDFAKSLAEEETAEADAASEYEKMTQENKETKTTELTAVLEYYEKLKDRCIAKPETYEERKRRREAEIAGLKEALQILEEEAAFVQRGARSGVLRR